MKYLFALISSLALTLLAYCIAVNHWITGWKFDTVIAALGIGQAWVQMVVFLHLGKEAKPRWNLITFLFMAMVTLILVVGSIWIMAHLNYNLMGH